LVVRLSALPRSGICALAEVAGPSPGAGRDDPVGLSLVRAPCGDLKELIHLCDNVNGLLVLGIEFDRLEKSSPGMRLIWSSR
jgi:hypothetical protein